jgi:hypothetical protein
MLLYSTLLLIIVNLARLSFHQIDTWALRPSIQPDSFVTHNLSIILYESVIHSAGKAMINVCSAKAIGRVENRD